MSQITRGGHEAQSSKEDDGAICDINDIAADPCDAQDVMGDDKAALTGVLKVLLTVAMRLIWMRKPWDIVFGQTMRTS